MKFKILLLAISITALGACRVPADTLIGVPGSGGQDCVPFGCSLQAQFIYSSSFFSGPLTITGLTFFNSVLDVPDTFDPATYTIRLSTTSASVAAPSTTFASNVGGDEQVFSSGVIPGGAIPATFTFTGTPFNYDPNNGNLLIEIDKPDGTETFNGFTDYNTGFAASRMWSSDNSGVGTVDTNYAPVVLILGSNSAVPEPAGFLMAGIGLVMLGGFGLRRRRMAVVVKA